MLCFYSLLYLCSNDEIVQLHSELHFGEKQIISSFHESTSTRSPFHMISALHLYFELLSWKYCVMSSSFLSLHTLITFLSCKPGLTCCTRACFPITRVHRVWALATCHGTVDPVFTAHAFYQKYRKNEMLSTFYCNLLLVTQGLNMCIALCSVACLCGFYLICFDEFIWHTCYWLWQLHKLYICLHPHILV